MPACGDVRPIARLLPVQPHRIGEGPVETIAATKLHTYLAPGRDCATWIDGRIKRYGFAEGVDYVAVKAPKAAENGVFPETGENLGGRPAKEWHLTLDMAKELAMVERNEKGREARRFINCERRYGADATTPPCSIAMMR